jgi:dihydrodipicolinate reductase
MGRTLVEAVTRSEANVHVSAASVLAGDPTQGMDVGLLAMGQAIGVLAQDSLADQSAAFRCSCGFHESRVYPWASIALFGDSKGYSHRHNGVR